MPFTIIITTSIRNINADIDIAACRQRDLLRVISITRAAAITHNNGRWPAQRRHTDMIDIARARAPLFAAARRAHYASATPSRCADAPMMRGARTSRARSSSTSSNKWNKWNK